MKTGSTRGRIRVIGGSLGGLLTANLLLRDGWDVKVYERSERPLAGRGAGIVTHPELFTALEACGVSLDDRLGVRVHERVTLGSDGRIVGRLAMDQVLTAWGQLFDRLREVFPHERYCNGVAALAVRQQDQGVVLKLSDGSDETVDLVISADGIRSSLRGQLAPTTVPAYAGYVAWRGLIDEASLSPETHAALFDHFAFCLPPREQILGYPVAGADGDVSIGRRRFNFVWYRPADAEAELADLLTDESGQRHDGGIAPNRIRPAVHTALRADAKRLLAPQFAEIIERTEQPFFQPIVDLASTQIVFGRTALVGDAAFVARPHCGMGVTKAAGDALALVSQLAKHTRVDDALNAYELERLSFGRAVVNHARHLGAYMQAQIHSEHERAMAERYRTPEAVMRETAASRAFTVAGSAASPE